MKEKLSILFIVISATLLRIYLISRDSIPFTYDMGRDLIWAKDISYYGIPTLIGPAASIWGVYFGPLWFYFLAIPLKIFGGNPLSAVYLTASTIILTGLLAYILFAKYFSKILVITLLIIILFSATLINISTFAFHANVLPILTLLTIFFSFLAVIKNPLYISSSFFFVSLMFHADPAPAVVFSSLPFFIYFLFRLYRKMFIQTSALSLFFYFLPFSPQILFEFRNNFIQTKSLIAYFTGNNPSLSGQLPLINRFQNRINVFYDFFKESFAPDNNLFTFVLITIILIGSYRVLTGSLNKNLKILLKINIYAVMLSFLIFTIPISVEIKVWYLFGLTIVFSFLLTISIYCFRKNKLFISAILVSFLIVNVSHKFLDSTASSLDDPAQLRNQLNAITDIEEDVSSDNYSVYIFTPAIYDLNFQYLYWWEGIVKNKRLPKEFAYLPNKPDYVRNKHLYSQLKPGAEIVYLIIEQNKENEFYTSGEWLKNFSDYQLIWEKKIENAFKIQKRLTQ